MCVYLCVTCVCVLCVDVCVCNEHKYDELNSSPQIHRTRDGEQKTDVQISGSEEAKEKAREMIEEIISSSSSRGRRRPGRDKCKLNA